MSVRRWAATVGATSLLVLVAGCGGSTPTSPPDATAVPPSPSASTSATAKPTDGGPVFDGGPVSVAGIPQQGVEQGCLLLDGYLLLGGDRALLGQGVPVTVSGHLDRQLMSHCQQGRPLVVDSVTAGG
ncbi:hypothetical protein [Angustibacter luteus]|uniref:Uncharacterized protein n=1 Tax=Angustibacter luteus TaxID=658456 RepID=A0ABW1JG87_9ACTN